MANDTKAFGGFDAIVNSIVRTDNDIPKVTLKTDGSDDNDDVTIVNDDDQAKILNDDNLPDPPSKTDGDDQDNDNDDTNDDDNNDQGSPTLLDEAEPEISELFASSLAEKLGIEFGEDKKFESVDDVIDLMTDIVKANSKPEYANDEVAKFDEYVRNGGSLKTFYDQVYKESIDINKVDLEDEDDQKRIIEANLKNLGYKEDRIKKTISRYENAEVLRDEAEDALEEIKEFQEQQSKRLLADQEKARIDAEKANKKFYEDVTLYINSLKDISGAPLNETDKKEIINYIFKVDATGTTGFQKEYASNQVKNLVETAYFTHPKYRQSLLSKTSKNATDDAMKKVRDKLKASKGKRNSGSSPNLGKASPNFSSLSGLITR